MTERRLAFLERAGGECTRCGYCRCPGALHFHHRNPEEKKFRLSSAAFSRSERALNEELSKCDLLCANCHHTEHHDERRPIQGRPDDFLAVCRRHGLHPHRNYISRETIRVHCLSCREDWFNLRRASRKEELVKILGGSCQGCGFSGCIQALHFHHVDPSSKSFELASHLLRRKEAVLAELAKCVLMCANCHAEVHAGDRDCPLLTELPELDLIHLS